MHTHMNFLLLPQIRTDSHPPQKRNIEKEWSYTPIIAAFWNLRQEYRKLFLQRQKEKSNIHVELTIHKPGTGHKDLNVQPLPEFINIAPTPSLYQDPNY